MMVVRGQGGKVSGAVSEQTAALLQTVMNEKGHREQTNPCVLF